MRICAVFIATLLGLLNVVPLSADAAQTISTIATSNAFGGLGLSIPSINNQGTVAFIDTSPGTNGVFTGNGGSLTTVVTSPTLFAYYGAGGTGFNSSAGPIINDIGDVSFWANTTGSLGAAGILSGNSGQLRTIVSGAAPVGTTGMSSYTNTPQISNAGDVVFAAYRVGGFPGVGIFVGNGGPTTPLMATDTEQRYIIDPAISPNGTIAYEWATLNQFGGPIADNLYLVRNGITTNLATISWDFFKSIVVNDHGTVAVTTASSILVGDGPLIPLADTTGEYSSFRSISINTSGNVAFYASLAQGGRGIFVGPDAQQDRIIATGDSLMGSTITQLGFGPRGMNDYRQVTFWAQLADGRQGVFVATPVPEPGAETLMLYGTIAVSAITIRKARVGRRKC